MNISLITFIVIARHHRSFSGVILEAGCEEKVAQSAILDVSDGHTFHGHVTSSDFALVSARKDAKVGEEVVGEEDEMR